MKWKNQELIPLQDHLPAHLPLLKYDEMKYPTISKYLAPPPPSPPVSKDESLP